LSGQANNSVSGEPFDPFDPSTGSGQAGSGQAKLRANRLRALRAVSGKRQERHAAQGREHGVFGETSETRGRARRKAKDMERISQLGFTVS
jgi:hypothetical protein